MTKDQQNTYNKAVHEVWRAMKARNLRKTQFWVQVVEDFLLRLEESDTDDEDEPAVEVAAILHLNLPPVQDLN